MGVHSSPPAFAGHGHRGSGRCAEVPRLQTRSHGGFWGREGLGSSPSAPLLGLSFLLRETPPSYPHRHENAERMGWALFARGCARSHPKSARAAGSVLVCGVSTTLFPTVRGAGVGGGPTGTGHETTFHTTRESHHRPSVQTPGSLTRLRLDLSPLSELGASPFAHEGTGLRLGTFLGQRTASFTAACNSRYVNCATLCHGWNCVPQMIFRSSCPVNVTLRERRSWWIVKLG